MNKKNILFLNFITITQNSSTGQARTKGSNSAQFVIIYTVYEPLTIGLSFALPYFLLAQLVFNKRLQIKAILTSSISLALRKATYHSFCYS